MRTLAEIGDGLENAVGPALILIQMRATAWKQYAPPPETRLYTDIEDAVDRINTIVYELAAELRALARDKTDA